MVESHIFITQVFISDITLSWNRWSSIYYLYLCILFNSLPLVAFSLHGWPHFFPVQWYQITSGQCHCQPSLWPMYWSKDKYLIISLQRAAVQFLNYGHSPYNERSSCSIFNNVDKPCRAFNTYQSNIGSYLSIPIFGGVKCLLRNKHFKSGFTHSWREVGSELLGFRWCWKHAALVEMKMHRLSSVSPRSMKFSEYLKT